MDSCVDKAQQQAFFQRLLDRVNDPSRFSASSHIRIEKIAVGYAEGILDVHPDSLNAMGTVHGGCLAALADTTAGMAVIAAGRSTVTVNYSLNFLRPATGTQIRCIATADKMGQTLCVMRVELFDDQSRAVAGGTFTFFRKESLPLDQPPETE